MAEIVLVRQHQAAIPEADAIVARRVLFGIVDGLGEMHRRRWRRFVAALMRMEPGEIAEVQTRRARSGGFHRFHMRMEQRVFEAQERVQCFKQFRLWLKLGAGFVDWLPGPKGGVFPVPRSIAYSELEDDDMREFHRAAVEFLRTPHAGRYLWPHLNELQRIDAIEGLLRECGE